MHVVGGLTHRTPRITKVSDIIGGRGGGDLLVQIMMMPSVLLSPLPRFRGGVRNPSRPLVSEFREALPADHDIASLFHETARGGGRTPIDALLRRLRMTDFVHLARAAGPSTGGSPIVIPEQRQSSHLLQTTPNLLTTGRIQPNGISGRRIGLEFHWFHFFVFSAPRTRHL